jgi:hypothetical protein
MHRKTEHVRDDVLHFRRMLGRRADENCSVLAAFRPGCIRLKIEMILTADGEFAF